MSEVPAESGRNDGRDSKSSCCVSKVFPSVRALASTTEALMSFQLSRGIVALATKSSPRSPSYYYPYYYSYSYPYSYSNSYYSYYSYYDY